MIPPEQLPDWMRPRRRRVDWALILMLLLTIPAVLPIVIVPTLPADNDAPLYISRSLQTAELLRNGILYSRWMPEMYNGLGSPLFNYLAPLPHYVAGFYELLTDTSATDTIRILTVLSLVAAGVGMMLFASRWGKIAGLVAGLFYLYSAPLVYTLPRASGDLASLMSLALLPCVLWLLDRAHLSRRDFAAAVIAVALWGLCDNRLTLAGMPPMIVFALARSEPSARERMLLALVIAAFLTAFFWLPALAERGSIVWVQATLNINEEWRIPLNASPAGFQPFGFQHLMLGWGVPGLALLAGIVAALLERLPTRLRWVAVAVLCALPVVQAAPLLTPSYPPRIALNTVDERRTGIYGTLRGGVLIPQTAFSRNRDIVDIAFTRVPPPAPDRPTFPTRLGVIQVERLTLTSRYTVDVDTNALTRFDRHYFPGWGVAVNGSNADLQPDSLGYAAHLVTPQARELLVYFGTTPARVIGWLASFAGAGLLFWQVRGRRRPSSRPGDA